LFSGGRGVAIRAPAAVWLSEPPPPVPSPLQHKGLKNFAPSRSPRRDAQDNSVRRNADNAVPRMCRGCIGEKRRKGEFGIPFKPQSSWFHRSQAHLPSAPHGVPLSPPCISPPTLCTHGVPLRPQAALVPSIPVLTTAPRVFPSQPPQQLVPWIPVPPPAPREFHSARSFDPRLLHPDHRTQGAPVRPKLSPKSQVIPTSDHPSVPKLLAQFVPMPTSRTQARPLPPSHCPCRTASTLLTQLQSPDKMCGSAGGCGHFPGKTNHRLSPPPEFLRLLWFLAGKHVGDLEVGQVSAMGMVEWGNGHVWEGLMGIGRGMPGTLGRRAAGMGFAGWRDGFAGRRDGFCRPEDGFAGWRDGLQAGGMGVAGRRNGFCRLEGRNLMGLGRSATGLQADGKEPDGIGALGYGFAG